MVRAAHRCAGPGAGSMKILGFVLLVSGWAIVLTAVALLTEDVPRAAFVLAGLGVELVGLALLVRAHPIHRGEHE
jgi:uncharacterized membrane protein YccC